MCIPIRIQKSVFFLFLIFSFAQALSQPITLRQAICTAQANNRDIAVLAFRIEEARGMVLQAYSAYHPKIRGTLQVEAGDSSSFFLFKSIDSGTFRPGGDFNDPGRLTNWEGAIDVEYELFSWGRRYDDVIKQSAAYSAACCEERALRNRLTAAVINSFFHVLRERAALETAEKSIATITRLLEIAGKRFEQGAILNTDLLKLSVRLAEAKERRIRSSSAEKITLASLRTLLGMAADSSLEIVSSSIEIAFPDAVENVRYAQTHRPEVAAITNRISEAKAGLSATIKKYWPRITLRGRTYFDAPDHPSRSRRANWVIGAALTWDLYTGSHQRGALIAAGAKAAQAKHQREAVLLASGEDAVRAASRIEEAAQRLKTAKVAEETAARSLELLENQYEGGSATITAYLEAEQMLTNSRLRRVTAFYDLKKAEGDYARSLGIFANLGISPILEKRR